MTQGSHRLGRWLLALALAAALALTLAPSGEETTPSGICLICGERGLADAILNLALFLPLGASLALARLPFLVLLLTPSLLSGCIETAQLFIPGRDASIGDLVFNSLGGISGILASWVVLRSVSVSSRCAARSSLAASLVAVGAILLTAVLLEPSLPRSSYYAQWIPDLGHLAPYDGRLLSASIGGVETPEGLIVRRDTVRALLLHGSAVEVRVIAGSPVERLGSIFSVYDGRDREIMLLGPDRRDLVFRIRPRAADLRLDRPDFRLDGALGAISAGDTLRAAVWKRGEEYCMRLEGRAGETRSAGEARPAPARRRTERCGLGHTAGRGWALLLYPERLSAWMRRLLDSVWVALLVLPVGYWTRRRWESAIGAAVSFGALIVVPAVTSLLPTSPGLALGGLSGWAAGVALGALARRALPGARRQGERSG